MYKSKIDSFYVDKFTFKLSRLAIYTNTLQGSKLGGAGSRGLPQISAGSPKMDWFQYTISLGSFRICGWAPWIKS